MYGVLAKYFRGEDGRSDTGIEGGHSKGDTCTPDGKNARVEIAIVRAILILKLGNREIHCATIDTDILEIRTTPDREWRREIVLGRERCIGIDGSSV